MRLNFISVWSEFDGEILQVIYEDSDTGTVYLVRSLDESVTVVDIQGWVSIMTKRNFEKLKVGEPID